MPLICPTCQIAFRGREPRKKPKKQKVDELLKDVIGGYELNAQWRAAYALCVVEARSREDDFKKLRLDPPEVTCLKSTDAFYPRGNGRTIRCSMAVGMSFLMKG